MGSPAGMKLIWESKMARAKILVLPGIGDIHWVMLKMQSFIKKNLTEPPDIYVWNFDGRPRSLEFVQRIPFVNAAGYWNESTAINHPMFIETYMKSGRPIIEDFHGFDYFLCVNGQLRSGRNFERDILPEYNINWDYPLNKTYAENIYAALCRERKPYILLYFSDHGMFGHWMRRWPEESVLEFIRNIKKALPGYSLVLSGSPWDVPLTNKIVGKVNVDGLFNLTGETSFDKFMAILRSADGFAGWPGGNTILGTHLHVPTYILWSSYFVVPEFRSNWLCPDRPCIYDSVDDISATDAASKFVRFIAGGSDARV
jgi:hypothetical protein